MYKIFLRGIALVAIGALMALAAPTAFAYPFATATTESLTSGDSPREVATGDFDGDGNIDIVVASALNGGKISILTGNGDGTFDAVSDFVINGSAPLFLGVGDFNEDGDLDVVAMGISSNRIILGLGDGAGSFSTSTPEIPTGTLSHIGVADFDGDGTEDFVLARAGGTTSIVHISDGDGTFSTSTVATGGNAQRVITGDFNDDTFQDFILAQTSGSDLTFVSGDGDGTFGTPASINITGISSATRLAAGDLDGDGTLDVVVNDNATDEVSVSLGDGDGTFAEATSYSAGSAVYGFVQPTDLDGDGDLDLIAVHQLATSFTVLINDGNGAFAVDSRTFTTGTQPVGQFGVADFDEDGNNDVALANLSDATVSVFLNTGTAAFTTTEVGVGTVVTEGGATDRVNFVLGAAPTSDVTVTITTDAQLSSSPGTITFTSSDWSSTKDIFVQAVDDTTIENAHTGTITVSLSSSDVFYDGANIATSTITVTVNDNDPTSGAGGSIGGGGGGSSSNNNDDDDSDDDSDDSSSVSDLLSRIVDYLQGLQDEGKALPSWAPAFMTLDAATTPGAPSTIAHDLELGDNGADVETLQSFLIDQAAGPAATALSAVGPTDFFGPLTQAALAEYQAAHGITPPAGYFGPITRAYLVSVGY